MSSRTYEILIWQIQRSTFNRTVNHVGIAVPDCEAAVEWYTTVLGFRKLIEKVTIIDRAVTPSATIFRIYPGPCNKLKMAALTSGNGIGIELFEFLDPKMKHPAEFDYTRGGFFHLAITDPDPESLLSKVIKAGGKQIGETVLPFDDETDVALYFQDPWGNTIEVLSCNWEMLLTNRAAIVPGT